MLNEIKCRRSWRKYEERMPSDEEIEKVVQAGLMAPSAINSQKGIVVVIKNKEVRDALSKLNASIMGRPGDPFYGAPVVLLVAVEKWPLADCDGAVMMENMMLEATHLGLGSCWVHRAKEELESEEGRQILSGAGIDFSRYQGVGHVILGYPVEGGGRDIAVKPNRSFYIE
ncbi:MAG: nitroreductase family protein [Bacilli bacterium]|nr:nitroreductase family protein [Bacilli bacterium]